MESAAAEALSGFFSESDLLPQTVEASSNTRLSTTFLPDRTSEIGSAETTREAVCASSMPDAQAISRRPRIVQWVQRCAAAVVVACLSALWGWHALHQASAAKSQKFETPPPAARLATPAPPIATLPGAMESASSQTPPVRVAQVRTSGRPTKGDVTRVPSLPAAVSDIAGPARHSTASLDAPHADFLKPVPAESFSEASSANNRPVTEPSYTAVAIDAGTPAPAVRPAIPAEREHLSEERAVMRTVDLYAHAYEKLDVEAAAQVWPSVDRRTLSRAFAALKTQGLNFHSCAIVVSEAQATARCRGTLKIVRKVGSPVPLTAEQEWVFRMQRLSGTWTIDQVSAVQLTVAASRGDHSE
jgi:hypothetical protein